MPKKDTAAAQATPLDDEEKLTEAERRAKRNAEAEAEWQAAAKEIGERQAEEEEAKREAEEDRRFNAHLAKIGGPQLAGDLTKAMLEILDHVLKRSGQKKGWKGLDEDRQKDIIGRCEWAAKALVRGAVSAVAADRYPALAGALKGVQIGDKGYKLVLETIINDGDHKLALLNSVSKRVLVVLADPDVYMQHDPIKPLRDQPEMFEDESQPAQQQDNENEPATDAASQGAGEADHAEKLH